MGFSEISNVQITKRYVSFHGNDIHDITEGWTVTGYVCPLIKPQTSF